jgi:hypothetical protein
MVPEIENTAWERLESLRQSETRLTLLSVDGQLREKNLLRTTTIINLEAAELTRISTALIQIDRELRRTVSLLDPILASGVTRGVFTRDVFASVVDAYAKKFRRGTSPLPVPIPVEKGGLRTVDVGVGSTNFVVEAYGYLVNVLVSQPITAFTSALTVLDAFGRVRVWLNQRKEALRGINSENALRKLEPFKGDAGSVMRDTPADVEIHVGSATLSHRPPRGIVRLSDGTEVSGRRIMHIRTNEDGTQDIIYVEG